MSMNPEDGYRIANRMQEAADKNAAAADRMESAATRIAHLLEDGYGGNGLKLIDALEKAVPPPDIVEALEIGLDAAISYRAEYDAKYQRRPGRWKAEGERMDADIAKINSVLANLPKPVV